MEPIFYVDDLFNGLNWKVVEHFGHRHIWDFLEEDVDEVMIVQNTKSRNVEKLCLNISKKNPSILKMMMT